MKYFGILILTCLLMSMSNCKSAQQVEEKDQMVIEKIVTENEEPIAGAYFQKWVAGVQGGGSGINLYIPINEEDSLYACQNDPTRNQYTQVYFKGLKATLADTNVNGQLYYVAHFKTALNSKRDLVMDGNTKAEYGNQTPVDITPIDPPIPIKEDEALITYMKNETVQYIKISGIKEKPMLAYPMQRRPDQNKN